jgi:hypothetical protein
MSQAAYLTVISPAEAAGTATVRDFVPLLRGVLGPELDRWWSRFVLPLPAIVGPVPRLMADEAVRVIVAAGGDAFAPTMEEIESLGPTLKIKRLAIEEGPALIAEMWRGGSFEILHPGHVLALVLGGIPDRKVKARPSAVAIEPEEILEHMALPVEMGMFKGMQRAADLFGRVPRWDVEAEVSFKLDLHTRDGRVFQIDGDKFNFDVLGQGRAQSDRLNARALADLLAHLCTGAVLDDYFKEFKAPMGAQRVRLPMMTMNNDDPEFAFYSRWAGLVYRHVAGI